MLERVPRVMPRRQLQATKLENHGFRATGATACGFQCIPPTHTDLKPPSILR